MNQPTKTRITNLLIAYLITFVIYNLGHFAPSDILLGGIFVIVYQLLEKRDTLGNMGENALAMRHLRLASALDEKRLKRTTFILAIIFTLSYIIYAGSAFRADLDNALFASVYNIATSMGVFAIFYISINMVLRYMVQPRQNTVSRAKAFNIKGWLLYSLVIFMAIIPMLLLNFPGTMTVDSFYQLNQARGIVPYSDHHPWFHTLLIKIFFNLGYILSGNVTVGIGTYSILQMLIVALTVGYATASIEEISGSKKGSLIILVGFIIYPYNLAYSITMWKDIIFSAFVLLLTITLYRIYVVKIPLKARDTIIFSISGLMMCLLRHNGFYAYVLTLGIIILSEFIKYIKTRKDILKKHPYNTGQLRQLFYIFLATIGIVFIINHPIQSAFNVEQGDYAHNLAIPLQQIGRTVMYNGEITDIEYEQLEKINSLQYIHNNYIPGGADNMIQWLVAGDSAYFENHKGEYFRLWLAVGLRNPISYLEAFLEQTKGYYTTMMPEQTAYYGILENKDKLDNFPIIGLRWRIKINEICDKIQNVVPIYAILYSMGACFLILIMCAAGKIYKKQYTMLYVYLPYFALTLSIIIATPLVADLRYAYPLMLAMPTLLAMTMTRDS